MLARTNIFLYSQFCLRFKFYPKLGLVIKWPVETTNIQINIHLVQSIRSRSAERLVLYFNQEKPWFAFLGFDIHHAQWFVQKHLGIGLSGSASVIGAVKSSTNTALRKCTSRLRFSSDWRNPSMVPPYSLNLSNFQQFVSSTSLLPSSSEVAMAFLPRLMGFASLAHPTALCALSSPMTAGA